MTIPRSSRSRPALGLASLLGIGLSALVPHTPPAAVPRPPAAVAPDSLPVDPALVTGILPNGLRYYIRMNHTPEHRASLRLVVNAGSALEDQDQRGLAHFLEHMAFKGTTHFPKHQLIDYLELAGMRFGADLNAYTKVDETVYMFTVPTDQPTFLEHGLQMLADLAGGGLRIDSSEVIGERGVVMGEWRFRVPDTASQHVIDHVDSVLYAADSRYVTRQPIGDTGIVQHAVPGPIRRFYDDWYRPDLMAIVVVGDIDPRRVEQWIKQHLATIRNPRHERQHVVSAVGLNSQPVVSVYRGPVVPAIALVWKVAPQAGDSKSALRSELIDQFLFEGLTRRYFRMREEPHRPFVFARAGQTPLGTRTTDATFLEVISTPDSLEGALAAGLTELERTARYGIPTHTLALEKEAVLRQLESDSTSAAPSDRYASEYTEHYLRGDAALMSPGQRLAVAREVLATITPEDVARAARFWHDRRNFLAMVNLPTFTHARPPTRASVMAVLDSIEKAPLSPDTTGTGASVADGPLIANPPQPGRIVNERRDEQSGITEWLLSNGARVLFKPTSFNSDELLIKALAPGGFSQLPDSLFFSSGRMVAQMMNEAAGMGALDRGALQQRLATTVLRDFKVSITNNDQSIQLGGSPRDLTTLFQLLYLQFTAPKLDTGAIRAWKQVGTPGSFNFDDELTHILSRGDPRRTPPQEALMQFADPREALAVYRSRFGNAGNFTFFIVGAAALADVRPLVERYVASLPSTGQHETAKRLDVKPWNEVGRLTVRTFDVPKAQTVLVFDGQFPSLPQQWITERQRLAALVDVLQLKLTNDLRVQMGGTYGVQVRDETYSDPDEHYRMLFGFVAAPQRMDDMQDALFAVLDSVRTVGPTRDELEKVAAIERRTREDALRNNQYWLLAMQAHDRLTIPFAEIASARAPIRSPEVIREAAQHYLPKKSFIQFTLLPTDSSYMRRDSSVHAPSVLPSRHR